MNSVSIAVQHFIAFNNDFNNDQNKYLKISLLSLECSGVVLVTSADKCYTLAYLLFLCTMQ